MVPIGRSKELPSELLRTPFVGEVRRIPRSPHARRICAEVKDYAVRVATGSNLM
jgi:hypothetical protein